MKLEIIKSELKIELYRTGGMSKLLKLNQNKINLNHRKIEVGYWEKEGRDSRSIREDG